MADDTGSLIDAKARQARERVITLFKANFARLIDMKRLSQADVARSAGMEPWELSRYATGKQPPKPSKVERIAAALGVEPDDLVPAYVSKAQVESMSFTSAMMPNGELWVEFAGAIPADAHSDLLAVLARTNVTARKPRA